MTDDPRAEDDNWAMERPPVVPEGVYPATLVGMTRKEAADPEGTRYFVVWEFAVEGGDTVEATSSMTMSTKGKAYPWIVALVGKDVAAKWDRIGPDERRQLVGRECMVNVIHNDDGFAKVASVMAARR
jgi:hypothetical protein